MNRRRDPNEERRKLFRRMEHVFVVAPPILALLVGIIGSALLALFVPIPSIGFWGRWVLGILIILVFPAIIFIVRDALRK